MKYQQIVFMQEHEADEAIDILEEKGAKAAFEYLLQWDYGEGGDETDTPPWGRNDHVYRFGGYVMSVNYGLPYIVLCKEVE